MRTRAIILCLALGLSLPVVVLGGKREVAPPQRIRVLILKGVATFRLYVKGGYEIEGLEKGDVLSRGRGMNTSVRAANSGIKIGKDYLGKNIVIWPKSGHLFINNRPYRGALIIRRVGARLRLINYIRREDYVKGVLFHEVSDLWPQEALKAQAIATRTYALYQAGVRKDKDYDLTADTYSQVYGGRDSERYRTNRAVDLTRGMVLTYRGKIFPAYFHATCGGATQDARRLWKINLRPLRGVRCDFCLRSPHYSWKKDFGLREIALALNKAGYDIMGLKGIRGVGRDRSGRVRRLVLITGKGKKYISANDFRRILGSKKIRSTRFEVMVKNGRAYFDGRGWGHGVGLCQWGAYFMARQGYRYPVILRFYYPRSSIEPVN
ncbi:MAG: SpoIID/LytB domain-containing protein [Candidatus Omnitrophota bacterium]